MYVYYSKKKTNHEEKNTYKILIYKIFKCVTAMNIVQHDKNIS
jgi:hypothetical protein